MNHKLNKFKPTNMLNLNFPIIKMIDRQQEKEV